MSSNLKLLRVCIYCNKTFTARTTKTRYCSKSCNSRDYHDSARDSKLKVAKNEFLERKLQVPNEVHKLECKPYLLNIKETCLLLNASDSTIRKMIKEGLLPTMRIGIKHLIRKSDIEKQFHRQ